MDCFTYLKCFICGNWTSINDKHSLEKVTVHKKYKKEIRDQKTVFFCLRKKIAFSKHSRHAVQDIDQFVELPRSICNADGLPEKGLKNEKYTIGKPSSPRLK
jgi:hypothetical protein